jgi:predicted transcriptional regulator
MLASDEGMTYERIGELLGITGAAVRLMIARAE